MIRRRGPCRVRRGERRADGRTRARIDGRLFIDSATPHGAQVDKATVDLRAGQRHSIEIEYTERTGEAHMRLLWSSPGRPQQIVPRGRLGRVSKVPPAPRRLARTLAALSGSSE
ncbi:PA14 domain-containing protein [Streptomyces sp. NBRC 110028]|uniref:PA14 domain-containing protein n=1 Tax=Streptomyces sp. NBRC 110028 TaxID=1621260 RepID=UPI000A8C0173